MMREEFSALLAAQFPHSLEERLPRGEPFPSYFVDSEAAVNLELPEAERTAAFLELERLSVLARSSTKLPTHSGTDGPSSFRSLARNLFQATRDMLREAERHGEEPDSAFDMDDSDEAFTQLSVGSRVVVQDLVATPSLNGAHGVVDEFQAENERYVVEFANGSRKLIHRKNLKSSQELESTKKMDPLKTGDLAKITGPTNAAALNGRVCRLQAPRGADRYEVKLPDGAVKAVKGSNLTVLPSLGTIVTASNVFEGAMVQRGPSWIWQDQDGGKHCLGRVLHFNAETSWATVRWCSGTTNCYRIGVNSKNDLEHADSFANEASYLEAVKKGTDAIRRYHLQRSFAYPCGVKSSHVDFFDIRDEVCQAFSGHKHGQRVRVGGVEAVMIGVADAGDDLDCLVPYYHADGKDGASFFANPEACKRAQVVGRQKVMQAEPRRVVADNHELLEVAKEVTPSFQYVMAPRSLLHGRMERYDIRDEICLRVGGFKHGQVVKEGCQHSVVIGVGLEDGVPKLFFHVDGQPGAGKFCDLQKKSFVVVGSRTVAEAPDDFLEQPGLAELRVLAATLQCTFGYPCGPMLPRFAEFDIRDHVCEAVGGFRHGQKVRDHEGGCAVVVGVRLEDDVPCLFFHLDGTVGAGEYKEYHLVRHKFEVIGSAALQQVPASDPLFQLGSKSTESLLHSKMAKEAFSAINSLPVYACDFQYDPTFCYPLKSLEAAYFDVRDEVCEMVGGFKHGDIVNLVGLDIFGLDGLNHTVVVIGVHPDSRGKPNLWLQMEGQPGAGIFQEPQQSLIRVTGVVVGRQEVKELTDPEPRVGQTFRYPERLSGWTKNAFFDVRDEVYLQLNDFGHGERKKVGFAAALQNGLKLELMATTMYMKSLWIGIETVVQVGGWCAGKFRQRRQASSSSYECCRPRGSSATPATETLPNENETCGDAVLLHLSRCGGPVKEALLSSPELAECLQRVVDAGCEVTPEWANGAVLLAPLTEEEATDAGLKLYPHHVVAFESDTDRVQATLRALPCKVRPSIKRCSKLEQAAKHQPQHAEDAAAQSHSLRLLRFQDLAERVWRHLGEEWGVVRKVDRTFWHFYCTDKGRTPSETSSSAQSAAPTAKSC
ncbi:MIB2 [Symbiodinium sp. CCMP2592]|nr:MIB2 [Symbiodinium sp. CCMP2592]